MSDQASARFYLDPTELNLTHDSLRRHRIEGCDPSRVLKLHIMKLGESDHGVNCSFAVVCTVFM